MNYAKIVLYSFFILPITACHSMTKTPAERCVLIDLQQERGKELFPILDEFAKTNQLEPDKSNPIQPRYIRGPKERSIAEVSYLIGMGRFGAELALFRYDASNMDLPAIFDTFVESEIAPKYKVTKCSDVPNYQTPQSYR